MTPEPQPDAALPVATRAQVGRAVAARVRPYRARLAVAGLVLVGGTVALLAAPPLLGEIIDRVLAGEPASAVAGVLDAVGRAQVAAIGEPVLAALREDVVVAALLASPDTIERAGTGDLVARVSGDSEAVSHLVGESLPRLVRSGLLIALTFVGLAALDWRLALAGLVAVPVQASALRRYLRVVSPLYAEQRTAEGRRAAQLLASISGAPTVRAYRLAPLHLERIAARCRETVAIALRTTLEQTRFYGRLNVAELIGTSAVLIAGFLLVRADAITVGAAAAALYFIRLFDPINTLLGLVDDAQEAVAALARLVGVCALPPRAAGPDPHPPRDASVTLSALGHAYPGGPPVLIDIDLTVRPGERLALVGGTGAGKTTLARLVSGALRPSTGSVRIGGVEVARLEPGSARPAVALVSQEVHTFAGPLAADLRLARPAASEAELRKALEVVGAGAWVAALPSGLDTVVGAGGHRLTSTQAQQLALARLVLADPLVAILDEATAEAGSAGARTLEAAAERALAGRTAIVVAHRLTQAAAADRVVVLAAGRIVEEGTHATLVAAGGPYAALWGAWSPDRC